MKALSMYQPWASLVVWGKKTLETRGKQTSHRGLVLIHAAKADTPELQSLAAAEPFREAIGLRELVYGAIVGMAVLEDCIPMDANFMTQLKDGWVYGPNEQFFGNYQPNRYAWKLSNPNAFKEPILYRGMPGLFEVPENIVPDQNEWGSVRPVRPTHLKAVFEIDCKVKPLPIFDQLVLTSNGTGFDILDEAAVLTWSHAECVAAVRWMCNVSFAASDNIVPKKDLIPPAHCVGVLK